MNYEKVRLESERVIRQAKSARFDLARIELQLVVTFCHIAMDTADHEKRARNLANARAAYQAGIALVAGFESPVPEYIELLMKQAESELDLAEANPDGA
jgi:hypothetical protein